MNPGLRPFSWLYGWVVRNRRRRLRARSLTRLPVPVLSVGNITTGGTGKTEVVAYLAEQLLARSLKPGILSRGYGRRSGSGPLVVSDGAGPRVRVRDAGDEPYALAARLTGAVVIVGADRARTGAMAVERFGCRVLVLDDGFQRRDELARDLDIVLVDCADPFGGGRLLPEGRLREPVQALAEADLLLMTRADQYDAGPVRARLAHVAPGKPALAVRHAPRCLRSLAPPTVRPWADLQGRAVAAVAGIARPEAFANTLRACGANVVGLKKYPDHHWYTPAQRVRLLDWARRLHADLVTTSKDAARWSEDPVAGVWALEVGLEFMEPGTGLSPWLERLGA